MKSLKNNSNNESLLFVFIGFSNIQNKAKLFQKNVINK